MDNFFIIDCSPTTTVSEFLQLVSVHPDNRTAHWSRWGDRYVPRLVPFDAFKLGRTCGRVGQHSSRGASGSY